MPVQGNRQQRCQRHDLEPPEQPRITREARQKYGKDAHIRALKRHVSSRAQHGRHKQPRAVQDHCSCATGDRTARRGDRYPANTVIKALDQPASPGRPGHHRDPSERANGNARVRLRRGSIARYARTCRHRQHPAFAGIDPGSDHDIDENETPSSHTPSSRRPNALVVAVARATMPSRPSAMSQPIDSSTPSSAANGLAQCQWRSLPRCRAPARSATLHSRRYATRARSAAACARRDGSPGDSLDLLSACLGSVWRRRCHWSVMMPT